MKTSAAKRGLLAGAASMLVVAGMVGLVAAPAYATDSCPPPVLGEDGQPVTYCGTSTTTDTIAPVVNITNPTDTTLRRNQTVLVTALAYDNVGVVKVELYQGGMLLSTSNGSTGAASWTPTAKGDYVLYAKAYDASGNVGAAELRVTVR